MNQNIGIKLKEDIPRHYEFMYFVLVESFVLVLAVIFVLSRPCRSYRSGERYFKVFIYMLMTSHLGVGVATLLKNITRVTLDKRSIEYLDDNMDIVLHFFQVMSFSVLTLLTFDRLLAVEFCVFYGTLTNKYCCYSMTISLILPIIYFSAALMFSHSDNLFQFFFISASLFLLFYSGTITLIYRESKFQLTSILSRTCITDENVSHLKKLHYQRKKSTRFCFFIVLTSIIFWIPVATIYCLLYTFEGPFLDSLIMVFSSLPDILLCTASLKDPLFYIYHERFCRKQFGRIESSDDANEPSTSLVLYHETVDL